MGSQKQTTENQLGAMSPQGRQALNNLLNASMDFQDPDLQMTPQDQALLNEIRMGQLDLSRQQIADNRLFAQQGVEESSVARGVDQSTMGAVLAAMLGHQEAGALNQAVTQGQIMASQQALQLPFQRSQEQRANNLAQLQRLVQTLSPVLNYDIMQRQGNATSTIEQSGGLPQQLIQLGARGAAAFASGGTSEIANAGAQAYNSSMPNNQMWSDYMQSPNDMSSYYYQRRS